MSETNALHVNGIAPIVPTPFTIEEQDVNPSGPTVTAWFFSDLHSAHPHFRWIKLEEPMMSSKVVAILEATGGEVGVLEGGAACTCWT